MAKKLIFIISLSLFILSCPSHSYGATSTQVWYEKYKLSYVKGSNYEVIYYQPTYQCTNADCSEKYVLFETPIYGWVTTTVYYRGSFIETVSGYDGQYPADGQSGDYWYVKVNMPEIKQIIAPKMNQIFGSDENTFVPIITVQDLDGDQITASYFIDNESSPRSTKSISNTATAQIVSFDNIDTSSLSEGKHNVRFSITDGKYSSDQSVEVLVDKTPPVLVVTNVTSTDSSITITGSASDSVAGLSQAPYRFTVGSATSGWTAAAQYTQYNLLPNTLYNVTLEARDNVGNSTSRVQPVRTKAQATTLGLSQIAENAAELTFNDTNPTNTQYQIKVGTQYVTSQGSLSSNPSWISPTNKRFKVIGLQPNTNYSLQAKARNELGEETGYSSALSVTTLASPPAPMTTEPTQTSVKLSWPAVPGVTSYDIEADGVLITNGVSTSFIHSGLTPNTKHDYRIRANNSAGPGNWSAITEKFTLPYPPKTPSAGALSSKQTEVTINWDRVARADSYDIEADGKIIELGDKAAYTHTGLQPETSHTYRIRAKNAGGTSAWSEPLSYMTLPYPPETPANIKADVSIHSVTLTWEKPERAVGYEIEVDGLIVDNGSEMTYLHEGLEALSGHTYRVRAKNAGGKSSWSQPLDVTTHPEKPDVPSNIMATSDESAISITWYKVLHTDSYEVEIDGAAVSSGAETQYEHTELSPGSVHTYRVRAKNISGYSEWSSPVTMSTLPVTDDTGTVALTNVAAIVTNKAITFSWDTLAPDAEYDIEVDGKLLNNGKNTIYHHAGLTANQFHTYKIRVRNGDQPGAWVAVLSLSTLPDPPDAPKGVDAYAADYSIELHWDKIDGASGYDVEIDGKTVSVENGTTYTDKDLDPGTSHTYRVRAKNITGVTAWSPAITKSTTNPTYTARAVQGETFDVLLYAYNVQDFAEKTFVVTYDPNVLDIADLCEFTPARETNMSGNIPGTPLYVIVTPGRIEYKVNQNIVPGTSWSGEIVTVQFKAKTSGQTALKVTME